MTTGRTFILALDVETTGPNPKLHHMYALAGVFVDMDTTEELAFFNQTCWTPRPANWDYATYEHFLKDAREEWRNKVLKNELQMQTPRDMVSYWFAWVAMVLENIKFDPRVDRLIQVVDTAYFDHLFLMFHAPEQMPSANMLTGEYCPWWDLRSYYAGLAQINLRNSRYTTRQLFDMIMAECLKAKKEPYLPFNFVHDHEPLHDARCIAYGYLELRKAKPLGD